MTTRSKAVLALLALATTTTCADPAPTTPEFTVRDSAGVEIVEHPGYVWATGDVWTVAADPTFRIGVADGEEAYLFSRIRSIVPLADGRLVIANGGTQSIRWFDADGQFLFERGGQGEGPGEFAGLSGVVLSADGALVATDNRLRRLTILSVDGELLETVGIPQFAGLPSTVFALTDRQLVVGVTGISSTQLGGDFSGGYRRLPTPLLVFRGGDATADTVGMFPGDELYADTRSGGFSFGLHPHGRTLQLAASADRIYVGDASRFVIDVFDQTGAMTGSLRAPEVDLTWTPEAEAAVREETMARYADLSPEDRAAAAANLWEPFMPAARPAYRDLLVDSDGQLWVAAHEMDGTAPQRWMGFARDGRITGSFSAPAGFTVRGIDGSTIYGSLRDDLDVEYVAAFALQR